MRNAISRALEQPWVYRLWMAPFAAQKLRPLLARTDIDRAGRVLDVGCGPGTNTHLFAKSDYVGIDINAAYVASARERHHRRFIAADVTSPGILAGEHFDFILVNSLLHHLETTPVTQLLDRLSRLLSDNGRIHVLDLVMPDRPGVARILARHDRGRHARPMQEWVDLLEGVFEPVVVETYSVRLAGIPLWRMVYFMGRAR